MERKLYITGKYTGSKERLPVIDKYDGNSFATVHLASVKDYDKAIQHAVNVFPETRKIPTWIRQKALRTIADGLKKNRSEIARILCVESGKPIRYALGEVDRATSTFNMAADILTQWHGDIIPLDLTEASGNRFGLVRRFPVGPILGISPFNFPLNLAAHKIAPALATGNPIILKPASATPLSVFHIADMIKKTELPPGMLQILPAKRQVTDKIIPDERLNMLTFTGSAEVGWKLKEKCGKKKIALELGGNAGVYVSADAELDYAVQRCVMGAFAYSGQVCISIQRIVLHQSISDLFLEKFIAAVKKLKIGDPLDEKTDIGPMIDEENAKRVSKWIRDAVKDGAEILTGGNSDKKIVYPTVMRNVPAGCPLDSKEVFGPVVNIEIAANDQQALEKINNTDFGLQAGLFTRNLNLALNAFDDLDVGGVILNDVPTFRVDNMPYGGVKDSGFGREGLFYTMEEMTEIKHLAINRNV